MKTKLRSLLTFFIGWPLSILSLFFITKLIVPQANSLLPKIYLLNPWLLLNGIVCFLGYFTLRAYFWQMILKLQSYKISYKQSAYLWEISEIKRYIPGNIWSFIGRANLFSKIGVPNSVIIRSLLWEAQFLVVGGFLFFLFSANFVVFSIFNIKFIPHLIVLGLVLAVFIISLIFIIFHFLTSRFKSKLINSLSPNLTMQQNITLLGIMVGGLVFFGLGNFFTISAVYPLYLKDILPLSAFFVAAFVGGYISFITPMGLGVREAIVTTGLSKYFNLSLAATTAIFSRIILVISELIFLVILFLWNRLEKSKRIKQIEALFVKHKYIIALLALIAYYIIYFSLASFLRYQNYFTGRFDLGNMDQTVWNTIHGRIFQLTNPDGTNIISRLAYHADFILVLIAPFYLLWQDPRMLLLLQSVVLGSGAIFVYLIAKNKINNNFLAFTFGLSYLLYPSLGFSNLYDFHAVTLATTFLLGSWYFLKKNKLFPFLAFLVLAALTKEELWIVVSFFGIYLTIFEKKKLVGILLFVLGIPFFYYLVWHAIPMVRGSQHFALSYYSDFGSTPTQIIKNILFSPLKTTRLLFSQGRPLYLLQILGPVGFLSLFSPFFLILASPDLGINMLSQNAQLHQIYYQYTAVITPFIFISAISGVFVIIKRSKSVKPQLFAIYILLSSLIGAYFIGPLPGSLHPSIDMFIHPLPYHKTVDNFIQNIPTKFSIAATNNIGSHLSHRQYIFTIPIGIDKADIILFLLNDEFAQPSLAYQKQVAQKMLHDKNYIEIFKEKDFVVFEKRNLYIQNEPPTERVKLLPYSIPTLQERDFGGKNITIQKTLATNYLFSSFLFSFDSDGLTEHGLINVPTSSPPTEGYPVVVVNHGFVDPKTYDTLTSYKEITSFFASRGFVVIEPDFRGNGYSEPDNTPSQIFGDPIDNLNLLNSLTTVPFHLNTKHIFLWGHALGAEVALATLESVAVNDNFTNIRIQASVLWAPVTDPLRWYQLPIVGQNIPNLYQNAVKALGSPEINPILWQSISPLTYLNDINSPIHIDQGLSDKVVPYSWAIELDNDLLSDNKNSSLSLIPDGTHDFSSALSVVLSEDLKFFSKYLQK